MLEYIHVIVLFGFHAINVHETWRFAFGVCIPIPISPVGKITKSVFPQTFQI